MILDTLSKEVPSLLQTLKSLETLIIDYVPDCSVRKTELKKLQEQIRYMKPRFRWKAVVFYNGTDISFSDGVIIDTPFYKEFFIDELSELEELIEEGPDFNLIENIAITYHRQ